MIRRLTLSLSFLLLLPCSILLAQSESQHIPISAGYWANLGLHPGVKIGAEFPLKTLEKEKKNGKVATRTIYAGPQLGVYNRRRNNTNLLIGAEAGIKLQQQGKKPYSIFSVGAGYLGRSQINTLSFSLGDGSRTGVEREWRSYFLPTVGYSFGMDLNDNWGWYAKASTGYLLSPNYERSGIVFIEVGAKFYLHR